MAELKPQHLRNFTGDPELQLYYTSFLCRLDRKDDIGAAEPDPHRCRACNAELSSLEGARLKPCQRMTRTIQLLIAKKSRKVPLSRMETFKLNKYMNSSQQMVVRCPNCTFVNKMPVLGRKDLIKLKSKLISEVEEAAKQRTEEAMDIAEQRNDEEGKVGGNDQLGNEGIEDTEDKKTLTEEHKKRKKRKKKKKNIDVISTLIHQKASEKKKAKKAKMLSSSCTPVSLRDFVLSEPNETPSTTPINLFHNATQSTEPSRHQTPSSAGVNAEKQQSGTKTTTSSSKKLKKSKKGSKKRSGMSLFFETPGKFSAKTKTPPNATATSARLIASTPQALSSSCSKKNQKKIMQKELKKYLTEAPQLQEKSSSLKDFLISL